MYGQGKGKRTDTGKIASDLKYPPRGRIQPPFTLVSLPFPLVLNLESLHHRIQP
jgi:hypothetical protein